MSVPLYKQKLLKLAKNYFNDITNINWLELSDHITEDVLYDAHSKEDEIIKILDIYMMSRGVKKSMAKITKKQHNHNEDPHRGFMINSDLLAFRLSCQPDEIEINVSNIATIVYAHGGYVNIRGTIKNTESMIIDIIQTIYIYLPQIGYIVEIQVGHPFAFYSSTLNTILQDKKDNQEDVSKMLDLWAYGPDENWTDCFYIQVRNKILGLNPELDVLTLYSSRYPDKTLDCNLFQVLPISY